MISLMDLITETIVRGYDVDIKITKTPDGAKATVTMPSEWAARIKETEYR